MSTLSHWSKRGNWPNQECVGVCVGVSRCVFIGVYVGVRTKVQLYLREVSESTVSVAVSRGDAWMDRPQASREGKGRDRQ